MEIACQIMQERCLSQHPLHGKAVITMVTGIALSLLSAPSSFRYNSIKRIKHGQRQYSLVEQLPNAHKTVSPMPSPTIIDDDDDDDSGDNKQLYPLLCCWAPSPSLGCGQLGGGKRKQQEGGVKEQLHPSLSQRKIKTE